MYLYQVYTSYEKNTHRSTKATQILNLPPRENVFINRSFAIEFNVNFKTSPLNSIESNRI